MNPNTPAPPRNILVAGGDPINRLVLRKALSQDYGVAEADNGRLALDLLLDPGGRFCAAVLDMNMPGTGAGELLGALREHRPELPVFLVVGSSAVEQAYELGATDVICRPVSERVALRRVSAAVELCEARSRLSRAAEDRQAGLLEQADRLIRLSQGMAETLAAAIESRSAEDSGHVRRVSHITRYILENTPFGKGLTGDDIENIALAATLHDVGKITVPDSILTKPGRLTPEEFETMKAHTTNGVLILDRIPQLQESGVYGYARDIALHHHERWDGSGYPDGLEGGEITPWAQAASLADVYDALSCRRAYKTGYPQERVRDMICSGSCGEFNPALIESFLSVEGHLRLIYRGLPEAESFQGT